MGLIKAEKITYVKLILSNGNATCEKTFSELCEMLDSGFLPVLMMNIDTGKFYLYPKDYHPDIITFSNLLSTMNGYERLVTVQILPSSINLIQDGFNTTVSFKAVISKTESGYECDRSYSEISQFCVYRNYTPLVQLKKDDPFNSYIPLVFGGREYNENGLDTFCFYYNNFITMKRDVFKIMDSGITMTETDIS